MSYIIPLSNIKINILNKLKPSRILLLTTLFLLFSVKIIAQLPEASSNSPVCEGSSIMLRGNPSGPYTYSWTGPVGFTSDQRDVTIPNATVLNAGDYILTVTEFGIPLSATTTVVVNALPATPTISADGLTTFCAGGSVTLTSSADAGYLWSTGATTQSINITTSGSYTVQVTDLNGCQSLQSVTAVVTVTVLPVAIFTYSAAPYCSNEENPLPAFSGGGVAGTFSSSGGLVFVNASTGQVNLSASTPGTYSVTNTITAAGGCGQVTISSPITITKLPTASLSYVGTPFCKSVSTPQSPSLSGTEAYTGGTYSASPSGLTIDGSTGAITPSTSTAGTYNITYTIPSNGGCSVIPVASSVTITALHVATFSYLSTPYCSNEANPLPAYSGGGVDGTFSSTTGLVFISTSTGQVNLSGSTPGSYSVTNTISAVGGCSQVIATSPITITALPVAAFSYETNPYCSDEANPIPMFSGGGVAGTFSSTTGLNFVNPSTGQVNLSASTPGTYSVTNIIPAVGACIEATASNSITITSPRGASIIYTGSQWCSTAGVQNITLVGTPGGLYSAVPSGLSINTTTGAITTSTSTAGNYTVTYSMAASGGCGSATASTLVTISPTPSAPVAGTPTQPTCSVATGTVVISGLPASGVWTLTPSSGGVPTSGTGTSIPITGIPVGSHTYTVTNSLGCISPASGSVTINPQPTSPGSPVQSLDCSLGFNQAVITVTSPTGAGLEYSLDGGTYQVSPVFNLVNNGSHYFSIRNAAGCTTSGTLFSVSCGCLSPPTVALSSISGNTCGITAVTATGNSFGGTATSVSLTSNGTGSLIPSTTNISPFSFTYTPSIADGGKIVTINATTNNPLGDPCMAGVATYTLTVNSVPYAPGVGTITNLTCTVGTGSVILNGLPSIGTWTLTRNPGAIITPGSGTSATVSGLAAGTYNFIVTSAELCTSASSADVVIIPQPLAPTAPVVGAITQPTCAISTGSVVLSGLPVSGTWILTRNPGGVAFSGSGTTSTILAIPAGTYTFSVTNSTGCISSPSGNVLVNLQPSIPAAPSIGTINPATCTLATGSVVLTGLPSSGTWTVIRYPGTIITAEAGASTTISGLTPGTYNFTVTTVAGCLSGPSLNVVIPAQPATPLAPVIGTITQPTLAVPSGSVVLNGLPSSGSWVIMRLSGGATVAGTGTSRTMTGLAGGVFTFTVTNSSGCTSAESVAVIISTPGVPVLIITNPPAVCSPTTVDITNAEIIAGSTPGLTYTYWNNAGATIVYSTPAIATAGTYYIKGTTVLGYFNIKPVIVTIDQLPIPDAGIDQALEYEFSTLLNATLTGNEPGYWTVVSGSGEFNSVTDPKTLVRGLSSGTNTLSWTVKRGACPAVFDLINIIVHEFTVPTLITPNMDGRNDYFVLRGLASLGKTELVIFDRRGAQVYKNLNYDNSWNGVDYNKNPLPDDTYFYVLKSANGKSVSGYIVIRR